MFKRVNQKTKPKEMKKTYNAKPSKYILIMGSLLLVYLFFFLKDMMLYGISLGMEMTERHVNKKPWI